VATVRALLDLDGTALLLHGPAGSGKTHLTRALMAEAEEAHIACGLLTLNSFADNTTLEKQSSADLLCIDGLDQLAMTDPQALSLLRILDRRRSSHRALATLVTASRPVQQLSLALALPRPDLLTRLATFASFGLKPLNDDHRLELLQLRASARGLVLSHEVASYLLRHLARDTGSLLAAIDRLDRASLAAQRRLTIPFAQAVLGLGAQTMPKSTRFWALA
jgi:DnaA family protein